MSILDGKKILITGGTGSFGNKRVSLLILRRIPIQNLLFIVGMRKSNMICMSRE